MNLIFSRDIANYYHSIFIILSTIKTILGFYDICIIIICSYKTHYLHILFLNIVFVYDWNLVNIIRSVVSLLFNNNSYNVINIFCMLYQLD